jgi:thiol-disulfide isomerase/thioredoxin
MNNQAARITGAALLVVLGIWAGAELHLYHHATPPGRFGISVPAGEASAPNPSDLQDEMALAQPPKIPDLLPQFSLQDRAGKATSIASFGDKSLIINFWATWCAPCRREIPLLEALQTEWAGRDMSVVGVAVDQRDKVLEFADRLKIGYPLLMGEQDALDAAAALGLASPVFPFTVFTDRRGEVVALFIGELHRPQAELILTKVQDLNQNLVELPAARRAITEGLRALKSGGAGPGSG